MRSKSRRNHGNKNVNNKEKNESSSSNDEIFQIRVSKYIFKIQLISPNLFPSHFSIIIIINRIKYLDLSRMIDVNDLRRFQTFAEKVDLNALQQGVNKKYF